MRRIVIIGGGVSGLATAYHIRRIASERGDKVDVVVLEKDDRPGGKAQTCTEEGYICDMGPNGFLDNKPWTVDLCRGLGVDDLFVQATGDARKRYIFSERRLHKVPTTPLEFFTSNLLSIPGRVRIAFEPFARSAPGHDESIHDFASRRIGGEAARKILNPMVSGVFAGATEEMSLKSAFPRIKELETNYGGLVRALLSLAIEKKKAKAAAADPARPKAGPAGPGGLLTTFKDGIQKLGEYVAAGLGRVVRTGQAVTSVSFDERRRVYKIGIRNGKSIKADVCIVASPAYSAASMLDDFDAELSAALRTIPYASCTVLGLGYSKKFIKHPLDGFGFLVPSREKRNILGCLFTSTIFPGRAPGGRALLRVFMGGWRRPEIEDWTDGQCVTAARKELDRILGTDGEPEFVRAFRYGRAIPQYTVGHSERLRRIDERIAMHLGLFLTGNAYRGVALNDCTREAECIAEGAVSFLLQG